MEPGFCTVPAEAFLFSGQERVRKMEETVASLALAVHEKLELKKNRLSPLPGNDSGKRICVVTGVHGDELEGQYVVYLLNRRIQEHPELLTGTVDIYGGQPAGHQHHPERGPAL